jgi:hypothetical protein
LFYRDGRLDFMLIILSLKSFFREKLFIVPQCSPTRKPNAHTRNPPYFKPSRYELHLTSASNASVTFAITSKQALSLTAASPTPTNLRALTPHLIRHNLPIKHSRIPRILRNNLHATWNRYYSGTCRVVQPAVSAKTSTLGTFQQHPNNNLPKSS